MNRPSTRDDNGGSKTRRVLISGFRDSHFFDDEFIDLVNYLAIHEKAHKKITNGFAIMKYEDYSSVLDWKNVEVALHNYINEVSAARVNSPILATLAKRLEDCVEVQSLRIKNYQEIRDVLWSFEPILSELRGIFHLINLVEENGYEEPLDTRSPLTQRMQGPIPSQTQVVTAVYVMKNKMKKRKQLLEEFNSEIYTTFAVNDAVNDVETSSNLHIFLDRVSKRPRTIGDQFKRLSAEDADDPIEKENTINTLQKQCRKLNKIQKIINKFKYDDEDQ